MTSRTVMPNAKPGKRSSGRWSICHDANDMLEIARLAALDHVDYSRERKAAAAALGISVTALDSQVKMARASLGTGATATKPLTLTEIVPWDTTVDGIELVGETIAAFKRHVILPEEGTLTAAFWTGHAHTVGGDLDLAALGGHQPIPGIRQIDPLEGAAAFRAATAASCHADGADPVSRHRAMAPVDAARRMQQLVVRQGRR